METKQNPVLIVNRSGSTAEILFYGTIGGYDGISSKDFVNTLQALERQFTQIDLRINSQGGDVFEGIAIINAIKQSSAKIIGYIDSLAASMAAVIALSLKECYISQYARVMTHKVTAGCHGTDEEMQRMSQLIASVEADLISIIATKAKITKEEAKRVYVTNTDKWLTANEAVQAGFVNGIFDSATTSSFASNSARANNLVNSGVSAKQVSAGMESVLFVSWDEMGTTGKLKALKDTNPQLYAFKFKQEFGKYPADIILDHSAQQCFEMTTRHVEWQTLRAMTYEQLHKANKVTRLKELDARAHDEKLQAFKAAVNTRMS